MPQPGDLVDAFSPQPGRCFRMVQSRQLQATPLPGARRLARRLDRRQGEAMGGRGV